MVGAILDLVQSTASTPRDGTILSAYRDIRASGAPKSVAACWRAIAERLPADGGPAVIGYDAIAKRARIGRRTAIAAVAFGVARGVLHRKAVKLNQVPGSFFNAINRYRWIGPPREPIKRGEWRAFVNTPARARGGATLHPEVRETLHPISVRTHSTTDEVTDGRPGGTKGDGPP